MQITAALVKELRERTGAGMMDCKRALVEAGGDIEQAAENMRKAGQAKADKRAGRIAAEGVIAVAVDEGRRRAAMVEVNCETDFVAKGDAFRGFAAALAELALAEGAGDAARLAECRLDGASVEERRRDLVAQIGENITVRRAALLESAEGAVASYVHGSRIGVLVEVAGGGPEVGHDLALHIAASRPLALSAEDLPAEVLAKEREILEAQVAASGKPPEIQERMVRGRLEKYLREVTLLGQPFVKDPAESIEKHLAAAGARCLRFVRFEVGEGLEKRSENFAEEVMSQVRQGGGATA